MKFLFLSIVLATSAASVSLASTLNSRNGDLYQGEEFVNDQPTGGSCYLYVDYVDAIPLGNFCFKLTTRAVFSTDRDLHPQEEIVVQSSVTNYHRPEYPAVKTCAMSLDGKTSGEDIYGRDATLLYNQLFAWAGTHKGNQFDFFVSFSPSTKLPVRTRLHKLNWFSEKNYDCLKLRKL